MVDGWDGSLVALCVEIGFLLLLGSQWRCGCPPWPRNPFGVNSDESATSRSILNPSRDSSFGLQCLEAF